MYILLLIVFSADITGCGKYGEAGGIAHPDQVVAIDGGSGQIAPAEGQESGSGQIAPAEGQESGSGQIAPAEGQESGSGQSASAEGQNASGSQGDSSLQNSTTDLESDTGETPDNSGSTALNDAEDEQITPVPVSPEMNIEDWIMTHSLEEKIAQMFIVTPEAIGGDTALAAAGPELEQGIVKYPVGGFIYFAHNLQSPVQTSGMLDTTKDYYTSNGFIPPFISVDEEGGTVARIANNPAFGVANMGPMMNVGATGDVNVAAYAGTYLSAYLKSLGFNMDMAPVADVYTNPSNTVIGNRAFGSDPYLVAEMVVAEMAAMRAGGVIPVVKHFPGHGATEADSHYGYASTASTLDELLACELVPFDSAVRSGCQCIMAGHISAPNVTGSEVPATLSSYMLTSVLRNRLGFRGVIITDAMNMGAVTNQYDSATAAILSINAGADVILMPVDFYAAYNGVLQAVNSGVISEERINESVRRILELKKNFII